MFFTLPLPPSVNRMYGLKGHIRFPSKELKVWQEEAWYIIKAKRPKTLKGDVSVAIHYFLKFKRDIDSGKALLDILEKAGVVENDNQVVDLHVKKHSDKSNPRVEIEVKPYES